MELKSLTPAIKFGIQMAFQIYKEKGNFDAEKLFYFDRKSYGWIDLL